MLPLAPLLDCFRLTLCPTFRSTMASAVDLTFLVPKETWLRAKTTDCEHIMQVRRSQRVVHQRMSVSTTLMIVESQAKTCISTQAREISQLFARKHSTRHNVFILHAKSYFNSAPLHIRHRSLQSLFSLVELIHANVLTNNSRTFSKLQYC